MRMIDITLLFANRELLGGFAELREYPLFGLRTRESGTFVYFLAPRTFASRKSSA
jgi:hypothetical protein